MLTFWINSLRVRKPLKLAYALLVGVMLSASSWAEPLQFKTLFAIKKSDVKAHFPNAKVTPFGNGVIVQIGTGVFDKVTLDYAANGNQLPKSVEIMREVPALKGYATDYFPEHGVAIPVLRDIRYMGQNGPNSLTIVNRIYPNTNHSISGVPFSSDYGYCSAEIANRFGQVAVRLSLTKKAPDFVVARPEFTCNPTTGEPGISLTVRTYWTEDVPSCVYRQSGGRFITLAFKSTVDSQRKPCWETELVASKSQLDGNELKIDVLSARGAASNAPVMQVELTSFHPSRNGWNFPNSTESFSNFNSEGFCLGMVASARDKFESGAQISRKDRPSESEEKDISDRHSIIQNIRNARIRIAGNRPSEASEVTKQIISGHPVVIGLVTSKLAKGGHAVLAFGFIHGQNFSNAPGSRMRAVGIYDPNFPNIAQVASLEKTSDYARLSLPDYPEYKVFAVLPR